MSLAASSVSPAGSADVVAATDGAGVVAATDGAGVAAGVEGVTTGVGWVHATRASRATIRNRAASTTRIREALAVLEAAVVSFMSRPFPPSCQLHGLSGPLHA